MGGSRFWSDMLWNGWIADILVIALFYVGIETRWVEDINYDKHRAIYLDKLTCAPFSLFVYCNVYCVLLWVLGPIALLV